MPAKLRRASVITAALAAAVTGGACDAILKTEGTDPAQEARVTLDGSSPVDLKLITSTKFVRDATSGQTMIELLESDTAEVRPDTQAVHPVAPDRGFYVKLLNPDTATADIRLRVFFDGALRYDQEATLSDAFLEFHFHWF